jgi:hypothetical protein
MRKMHSESKCLQGLVTQTHQHRLATAAVNPELSVACAAEALRIAFLKEKGIGAQPRRC